MFKNFGLTKQQLKHVLKVTGWVAVSTAIGGIIGIIASNPAAFGIATPIVNVFLITLQQLVKEPEA